VVHGHQTQGERKKSAAPFQAMLMERFTEIGNVQRAAISPDGKYLAYASGSREQQSLWLRQMATHTDIRISQPEGGVLLGLTFSHDSNYVYYVRRQISMSSDVYRVPSLGGEPQKLAENVFYSDVALSPDDKQMAFVQTGAGAESSVVVIKR
jgi:Tol biopolymer transport system component